MISNKYLIKKDEIEIVISNEKTKELLTEVIVGLK